MAINASWEGLVGISLGAEPLLALAVTVTSEQRVDSVLWSIVQGLASQPGVALARIWLLPSVDLSSFDHAASDLPNDLYLVASAGTPINSPGEDWNVTHGDFTRVPFDVGKVGQVTASRLPVLIENIADQADWVMRPEWAKREEIRSFAGHPLIFRDKLLGVLAVFSRQPYGQQEFTWLGLFANQAAAAIANARSEEALQSSERNLTAIINTIPTAAWTTRPDGYCDFLNQVWLNYAGMTAQQAQGWGWAEAIHTEDRKRLVEEWQSSLASGDRVDTEARIRRFDGAYRWFLIRGNPLRNEAGNILKWYGTCVDIEDRKRGEEDLRARELSWRQIVDNIPGLVATTGAMGEVEFLNRQTLEYFGRTREELKDWALIGAVHPDDLPHVIEERRKSIEKGQIYEVEHRCRRADGVYRWFQVRGLPVRGTKNQVISWYLLLTDIDDRKRAEEALRASEFDARSSLDNLPGLLSRAAPDGTPEIANRPFLQYFGKTLDEIAKWKSSDLIHPDDLAQVTKVIGNGISGAQPFEYEHRILRFDGVYRWFHSRWLPVRNSQGQMLHWNILITDINERKQAEEALRSSERNLRLMINVIPTYIHVLRPDGSVIYVNPAVLEYTGLTLEEVQRENYRDRVFHPDDVKRLREEHRQALTRSVPFDNEQRMLDKEGKYRWFLIRYNPLLDEEGKIDRWYAAATEIDDRKRAEEALRERELNLRQVTETIPEMLWSSTPDGSIDYCNGRLLDFTGFSAAEVQGTGWIKLLHPDDVERAVKAWSHCVRTGDPYRVEVRTMHASDHTYRWCVTRALPLLDSEGRIVKWHGTVVDMHDWKVAQEELRRTQAELAKVMRVSTLNVLTASIAHEIKQPLASLITNASISLRRLNDDPPNVDGARETVQRTIRDANRTSDVVTRLRALFSRKEFTLETFDLNEIIREVIALSLTDLQGNRVILQSELATNLPLVTGDRVQLQQVTLNLLHNASDAMVGIEDRPRQLLIRTQRDGDDQVRLSVQDVGCGVNPQDFERLFEPFYTTKSNGMGIGLSISRSIIERHKGRLWAEPNAGPGTTFCFSIPRRPDRAKDSAA